MTQAAPVKMLVLDDDEQRIKVLRRVFADAHIEWVQTAPECIDKLNEPWDVIRLDHDLGGEIYVDSNRADTGMEVVRHLEVTHYDNLDEAVIIVHTRFDTAGKEMAQRLKQAGYDASYHPFAWGF